MNIGRSHKLVASLVFAFLLATTLPLGAQQPSPTTTAAAAPVPVFDVVAIHENKSGARNATIGWGGDAFVATNTTLVTLLMNAYGIRDDLMSGVPGWAYSVHFNVNAKISDPDADALKKLSREQHRAMMVTLLNDRFHLRTHIEIKTLPVYDLVIAKGGSKLKENAAPPPTSFDPGKTPSAHQPGSFFVGNSEMTGIAIPISTVAGSLAFYVERNIIDKTGLTGRYDINLKWTPAELEGKTDATDNNAPDLFTALQEQLGLKLEPSKGPVPTLVIDHVEMPSEN
jgi:uncharacterized protein (TIGR03435 family)